MVTQAVYKPLGDQIIKHQEYQEAQLLSHLISAGSDHSLQRNVGWLVVRFGGKSTGLQNKVACVHKNMTAFEIILLKGHLTFNQYNSLLYVLEERLFTKKVFLSCWKDIYATKFGYVLQ